MNNIEFNRTFEFDLSDKIRFDDIPNDILYNIFRDGRNASFMLEQWLTTHFEGLTRIVGNRDHDHVDTEGNKYDAKNFTKCGLKFMPSSHIGAGRTFNRESAHAHARNLIYICCDIVDFPSLRIRFVKGEELIMSYPNCSIKFRDRESFFNNH